jgi:hypothetical protein
VLVILYVVSATILLEIYTLRQFERATTLTLEHEGLLLSDILEASITPFLKNRNVHGMQDVIDRIGAILGKERHRDERHAVTG